MKNKKGGNKTKKSKPDDFLNKRELIFKETGQEYAIVSKLLGNCNILVKILSKDDKDLNNKESVAHIRGKFRNRVYMRPGDLILASSREFEEGKFDVIHVFTSEEMRKLKNYHELPEDVVAEGTSQQDMFETDDVQIDFDVDDI